MKLRDAVLMGRFCGLETVEECVRNIDMHCMSLFLYSKVNEDLSELGQEYSAYIAGDLILDWPKIKTEVEQQLKDYEESERNREPQEVTELFENN